MLIFALCFLSWGDIANIAPPPAEAAESLPPTTEHAPPLSSTPWLNPEETPPPPDAETTSLIPAEITPDLTSEIPAEAPPSPPEDVPPQTPEPTPPVNSTPPGFSFYGLYPLWEATGNMLEHRRVFIGNNWFAVGFAHRFSLGIRPTSFFFRVPNVDFKALIYEREHLKVSMQLAPSLVLPGASNSFTTTNFTSRFDDNHHYLWLLPLSANASWQLLDELSLHASLTALGAFGKQLPNFQVTLGLTVFAEFMAWKHHSFMLHLGEIGFWDHDIAIIGASYRFHWKWIEAQLGYFYRFSPNGNQGGALIALGVLL